MAEDVNFSFQFSFRKFFFLEIWIPKSSKHIKDGTRKRISLAMFWHSSLCCPTCSKNAQKEVVDGSSEWKKYLHTKGGWPIQSITFEPYSVTYTFFVISSTIQVWLVTLWRIVMPVPMWHCCMHCRMQTCHMKDHCFRSL